MTSLFSPILRCFIVAVYMTYKSLFPEIAIYPKIKPDSPFSTSLQTVWSHLKTFTALLLCRLSGCTSTPLKQETRNCSKFPVCKLVLVHPDDALQECCNPQIIIALNNFLTTLSGISRTETSIILDIPRKPNSIIILLFT